MWGEYNDKIRAMIKAFRDLKGKYLVPIHNGTFNLAFHPWYEPMERIMTLSLKENIQIIIPIMGQIIDIENVPKTDKWWKSLSNDN